MPSARTAATRTWYVVDRRLLVDAAFEHGRHLAALLQSPESLRDEWSGASRADVDAIAAVGESLHTLAHLGTKRSPLHIVRLRGGAEIGQRSPDPSQPALIFSTVAMYSSRLLFRGYGSSLLMRPVDAALAGIDSLVLLDEAHLARPLVGLCRTTTQCDLGDPSVLLPTERARPRLVALTATGDDLDGDRFNLDDDDRADPTVARRFGASKPTRLVLTSKKRVVREMAEQAARSLAVEPQSAGIVFCNTVATARGVKEALDQQFGRAASPPAIVLLTGRMRTREAGMEIERILHPINGARAGRTPAPRERGLIVVATQTLEVGADLDFDFLVTESAGARALIQRFGRLNRFGACPDPSAVICHPEDAEEQPPYGTEPAEVWRRLSDAGGLLDLSPERIDTAIGAPGDTPTRVGQLLPSHMWEYAKTSRPEPDEAPVELFFAGFDENVRRVSVCWRSHLPLMAIDGGDAPPILHPSVREDEAVDVPITEVRRFLGDRANTTIHRLSEDGVSLELVDNATAVKPGDTLILSVDAGGYDQSGWNPEATETVLDVAALGHRLLWLDELGLRAMVGAGELSALLALCKQLKSDAVDGRADGQAAAAIVENIRLSLSELPGHRWLTPSEWEGYRASFDGCTDADEYADGSVALVGAMPTNRAEISEVRADAFDGLSFDVRSALLREHLGSVGETAHQMGSRIGLPAEVVNAIGRAGAYHDIGKSDARFQRWLDPHGKYRELLAKSGDAVADRTRTAAGWPRGGRHEALSGRLLQRWLQELPGAWADADLILHLVLSHHGHGRPLVPSAPSPEAPLLVASVEGITVRVPGDLASIDWEQPRRFRALCGGFGYWGLALLETVVRQSDHAASVRREDATPVKVA
jgi:CRISPR-associated endonuclease/helicase Cas3